MQDDPLPQPDGSAAHLPPAAVRTIPHSVIAISAVIVAAITFWLCGRLAFSLMFTGFHIYDDEGAALIVLDQMAHGHALYDQVPSTYGPFGFLPKYLLIELFSLPVTHDTGRALTLAYWMLACVALGLATWRLTRSVTWFGIAMVAACLELSMIVFEPGHSQDMCCLLLSLALLASTFCEVRKFTWVVAILGILGGLLAMTKINLAAFYFGALAAALVYRMSPRPLRTALLCGLAPVLVISPMLLMYPTFARGWSFFYAAEISLALIACFAAAKTMPATGQAKPRDILACAGGLALAVLVVSAVTIALGTSPKGLIEGVILMPLRVSKSFVFSQGTYGLGVVAAIIGLFVATAAAARIRPANPPSQAMVLTVGLMRVAVGLMMLRYIWIGGRWSILIFDTGFAWLLLLPVHRPPGAADHSFARVFLAFLAILEAMWAYPVSGTQLAFAVFLLSIGGIVTFADGVSGLSTLIRKPAIAGAVPGAVAVAAFGCAIAFTLPLRSFAISTYEQQVPLDLPGSHWIHLPPADAQAFQEVTNNLRENADVFYTMPGMNSFYSWAQMQPPTPANLQQWMYLLSDDQQRQAVQALEGHPRAGVLINGGLCEFWMQGQLAQGPLVQYFSDNFRPTFDMGGSVLWVRKDRTSVVRVLPDGTHQIIQLPPTKQ